MSLCSARDCGSSEIWALQACLETRLGMVHTGSVQGRHHSQAVCTSDSVVLRSQEREEKGSQQATRGPWNGDTSGGLP